MTAPPEPLLAALGASAAEGLGPAALLAALRTSAGSAVDGAGEGAWSHAPDVSSLTEGRASAVLAAWTGARLHAGAPGLLVATDPDVALLVGDWCFAHALQALAHAGDLAAIGVLATAIGACATGLEGPVAPGDLPLARLAEIWSGVTDQLRPTR